MTIEKVQCLRPGCGYMIGFAEAVAKYGPKGPTACPRCGYADTAGGVSTWPCAGRTVKVTHVATTVCDATCLRAKGSDCKCSCDGANHGAKT